MPIRTGVSMYVLGEKVRHDAGHKRDHYVTLADFFEWAPVCPEVEVGMGTPREAIQLVQLSGEVCLVGRQGGADHTDAMGSYARRRVEQLASENLSGYFLKKDSPSCGLDRVRLHHGHGRVTRSGRGLLATALVDRLGNLPIEEEGRPCDPRLRSNWIERVFAYHRLRARWATRWRVGDLVAFHTSHKLVRRAHSPQAFQQLGRVVAASKTLPRGEPRERYERESMAALTTLATRRFDVEYLKGQVYLNPHPKELALRNHACRRLLEPKPCATRPITSRTTR